MALFSYKRYYKPGKGVEKDAPEKNAFFRFFEIYGRKFWRFIQVNLIYLLILLPILMTVYAETYDTLYVVFDNLGYAGSYASLSSGNLTVTAKTPGAGGNDYTLDIDADKNDTFTVTLYTDRGTAARDSDNTVDYWIELEGVASVEELTEYENDYVTFSGSGPLEVVHAAQLSGGSGFDSLFTPLLYLTILYYEHVPGFIRLLLLVLSVLAYGPAKCGVTYVLRNFSRQTHSWISDIWDKAKENWKQGMLFGVIDCAVAALVVFNLTLQTDMSILHIAKYLTLLAAMFYVFMRKYIYLMIVTVQLNLQSLVKNAWLLAFIGIFRNFFSGLANLLFWVVTYLLIAAVHPMLEIVLLGLFAYSFTNFVSISACYPLIDKYLVKPIAEMQAVQKAAEAGETSLSEPPPDRSQQLF